MKITTFISGIFYFAGDMLYGFLKSIPCLWTNEKVFWNIQNTFFDGENAQEARDEYVAKTGLLLEEIKKKYSSY